MGECKDDSARLFSVVSCDRTRGNGHKLSTRKHFFYCEGGWNLKEVAQCPELFKTQLDTVLGNLL